MEPSALTSISPIDGRYARKVADLRRFLSEFGLIRYRTLVEVRWLQFLADLDGIDELPPLSPVVKDLLNNVVDGFSVEDARRVKEIESSTNHDVKAVEYYLRERLEAAPDTKTLTPFLHFACTSEDINNLAYALMFRDARKDVLLPGMTALSAEIGAMAKRYADVGMLARTHGQPATPTTLGKEFAVFARRLKRQREDFAAVGIEGKMNGAVGNYNAHVAAYPEVDWPNAASQFVDRLGIDFNPLTTQIEPHDWIAAYCHGLSRFNTVVIDLCRDIWGYISLGYFKQRTKENEIGSSTMPHKVNPIDFENAEGNCALANANLQFLADKLPISRWQRDLSDSTVLRNVGVALAHSYLAWQSARQGLEKLEAMPDRIGEDLNGKWEVLAEAVQTVMRRHGLADAYEQLKALTRGQPVTEESLKSFIDQLDIPDDARQRLRSLSPSNYLGLAARLSQD